tara:strand:+ start:349 stop:1251 length:903 start_codon:yes stop_codon:yes gene_type:complete
MKNKYVFIGDIDSINLEIISRSHLFLKNKVKYILLGRHNDIHKYLKKIKSKVKIHQIIDPLNFENLNDGALNLYNIENITKKKYENLMNQIKISNKLANLTKNDLITMPINKSVFKKELNFIGMTEFLGDINKKRTLMLMHGEKFSIIPLTTHINLKDVHKHITKKRLMNFLDTVISYTKNRRYKLNFKKIYFICYNPHCGEEGTIGFEDKIIFEIISKYKNINGPIAADSAFKNYEKNSLFLSTYHDQALIPFKISNKRGFNFTLGLNYRRLSPAHGTAENIKFKQKSDLSSYIECMLN